jgi:hypothetical protein
MNIMHSFRVAYFSSLTGIFDEKDFPSYQQHLNGL